MKRKLSKVEYIFKKTCLDKISFSEEKANRTIDKYSKLGILLFYYKCPFCESFHMTRELYNPEKKSEVTII